MKKLFALVFVALLISLLGAGIKKTLYKDYGIVVFHPDSLISVRAHQIVWGNLWVIQSDSTDTMSMTPDKMIIDSITITDYLHCTDDVRFDSTLYFTDGGADTSSIVQDGTNLKFASDNPFAMSRQLTFTEDADRTGEGTILFANAIPIGMATPGDCQGMKTEFNYGVTPTLTGGGKVIQGLMLKMTMDQRWKFASANRNADVRAIGVQAELNDSLGGVLSAIYANAYTDIASNKQIIGEHTTGAYGVGMCAIEARTEIKGAGALTVPHIAGIYVLHRRMGTGGVTGDYHAIHIENSQGTGAISGTETAIHFEPNTMAPPGANFDYGIDMEPVAFGTADVRLSSGATVRNPDTDTLILTEANIKYSGKLLSDGNMWMQGDSIFFTDGGADTNWIVNDGSRLKLGGDIPIQLDKKVYFASTVYGSADDVFIEWAGYGFKLDADGDDSLTYISFNAQDSIKYDSVGTMFTITNNVTLGDTINTVFLPKGTRLIIADSSGADSVVFHNDGVKLSIISDNKIELGGNNIYLGSGDTLYFISATPDTFFITNQGGQARIAKLGGNLGIDASVVLSGSLQVFGNATLFDTYCREWRIDSNSDDSLALITWFATDSLRADTISYQLEWTGSGGIRADGGISGDNINDAFAYQCAGDIFNIASNSILILGWISPATTEQDLSPHNRDATYQGTMTTGDQIAKGLVWKLDFDATDDYLSVVDHADFTFDDAGGANGFTMGGWVEVVATATDQVILSKWDEHTNGDPELREWKLWIDSAEKLNLRLADESVYAYEGVITDDALSVGWHLISAVYDGVGGTGASAGITIYIDGVSVALTLVDNGTYVGMEDLATSVFVGAHTGTGNTVEKFWQGDMGHLFITTDRLSADQNWELYLRTRGYYNE